MVGLFFNLSYFTILMLLLPVCSILDIFGFRYVSAIKYLFFSCIRLCFVGFFTAFVYYVLTMISFLFVLLLLWCATVASDDLPTVLLLSDLSYLLCLFSVSSTSGYNSIADRLLSISETIILYYHVLRTLHLRCSDNFLLYDVM